MGIEGRLLNVGGIQFDPVPTPTCTCVGCAFKGDGWLCTLTKAVELAADLNCAAPSYTIYKLHTETSEVNNA